MQVANFKYMVNGKDPKKDIISFIMPDGLKIITDRYSKIEFDFNHELIIAYEKDPKTDKDFVSVMFDIYVCLGIQFTKPDTSNISDLQKEIDKSFMVTY